FRDQRIRHLRDVARAACRNRAAFCHFALLSIVPGLLGLSARWINLHLVVGRLADHLAAGRGERHDGPRYFRTTADHGPVLDAGNGARLLSIVLADLALRLAR